MSIKTNIIEIKTEQYKSEQMSELNAQYTGRCTVLVKPTALDNFYRNKELDMKSIDETQKHDNEFALLVDVANNQHTALARFNGKTFVPLRHETKYLYHVKSRNIGQKFALEALLPSIESAPLVILKESVGIAKTFYALTTGLAQTLENNGDFSFDRILVARPNVKFDEDIGYLKGGEDEKIELLIRPIIDNLEQLTRTTPENKDGCITNSYVQDLFDREIITAQALAYMRGRSITNTWIIIDEAQNMTPAQAFGIISRAGIGSKIVLVGDPKQIDNPHLDSRTNGLSYVAAEKD